MTLETTDSSSPASAAPSPASTGASTNASSPAPTAPPTAPPTAFKLTVDDAGIATLMMDVPGEAQNTIKASFADEFEAILQRLETDTHIQAVVLMSGKPDSFLVGADVKMLEKVSSAHEATQLSRRGQQSFDRLSALKTPVVVAIHGACLGGGLELALACHGRVCSDDKRTELALPEVQLGLLPGAGGTQRLPRLIGIATALDLMLTGKKVKAPKALKLGLVDDVVPRAHLFKAAVARAQALKATMESASSTALTSSRFSPARMVRSLSASLGSTLKGLTSPEGVQELLLEDTPVGRMVLFQQARKQLQAKTQGNYPAPESILDAVELGMDKGMEEGLKAEARLFGELVVSPQARQLMGVFFATTAMKKDSGVDDPTVQPRPIRRVGMLGAGLMGAGIAYTTASLAGIPVRLKDKDEAGVARGLKGIHDQLQSRVKRKSMTRHEATVTGSLVTGTTSWQGVERCEVVIEAVFESLELKHRLIREVEAIAPLTTIFASNTSSIPITRLAEASSRPETVIGMHYFSPVEKMPLLEVIVTEKTAPWVVATCVALGKKQGKTVIVVKDGVGFYTSRILAPYMNEAARILSEGVAIERIDQALKSWGYPVGPITLMDEVGIDVGEKVGHIMIDAFGERMAPPAIFQKLVSDGRAGRKNQKGFYLYGDESESKQKKKEVDASVYQVLGVTPNHPMEPLEIAERCALQMVNEAMLCYGEGILRSPRDGDIGAIFGLGFPPFRGGPFRYVDTMSAGAIVRKLEDFANRYGSRFKPAPILVEMAASGKKFHG